MTRHLRRLVAAATVAFLAPTLGACGIDFDTTPRPLAGDAGITTTPQPASGRSEVLLFVVRSNTLSAVLGRVADRRPSTVLTALLAGPLSAADQQGGLTTAIPQGTQLRRLGINGGTAEVDLSSTFGDVQGVGRQLAVAQIVQTLTQLDGVDRVTFLIEGAPIKVPSPTGDSQIVDACDSTGSLPDAAAIGSTGSEVRDPLSRRVATVMVSCAGELSE